MIYSNKKKTKQRGLSTRYTLSAISIYLYIGIEMLLYLVGRKLDSDKILSIYII